MITLLIALVIFLDILYYLVLFDVILSWLMLAGVRFRPSFIKNILDPIYFYVKKYIPTRIGAFELTPIIVILGVLFVQGLILMNFPEVGIRISQIQP